MICDPRSEVPIWNDILQIVIQIRNKEQGLWIIWFRSELSCIFSIITPVFSVTWSFRNHNNMLICCSRNISDYYQCWKQLCCTIFLWKPWFILFFRIHRWIESSKEQHLFEIEIYCNIINVFTVTFEQCKVSLLNKSINVFKLYTFQVFKQKPCLYRCISIN